MEKQNTNILDAEYSKQHQNMHSDKEQQSGQNMQQSISYESKTKPKVKVILEFPEDTEEAKQSESEFISLLKKLYLEKVLKSYMQEEELALESSTTKEDKSYE